jgi:mycothiol system anti-sigma-R factor
MDCKEAVAKLYLYLDGEVLTPQERKEIEEHLKLCRKCCEKFEFERNLWNIIKAKCLDTPVPPTLISKVVHVINSF